MTLDRERDLSKYAALLTAAKSEQDRGDLKVQLILSVPPSLSLSLSLSFSLSLSLSLARARVSLTAPNSYNTETIST
jgi:hypothetical protein